MRRKTDSCFKSFLRGYLACALWSSIGENGEPLDYDFSIDDFTFSALLSSGRDCWDFIKGNSELLDIYAQEVNPSDGDSVWGWAGHDFWLTRNRHGAGFWDRGLGATGEQLSDACRPYGYADVYADTKNDETKLQIL